MNFEGEPVERASVVRMNNALAHRGPDGSGVWVDGNVGFGHRRLAIRDLSSAGAQPMIDRETGIAVTYNGEIYNDQEIRRELTKAVGTKFHTNCDTEVIAPAYRLWRGDSFLKFEGMYAMALWDQANEQLILARDPVGIKPLYFSFMGRSLRFASEIKALLTFDDQRRKLSAQGLHRFLAQGFPGPARTLIEGIVPLLPGSMLVASRDEWHIERLWEPRRRPRIRDSGEALAAFERLWPRVVSDQLVSDVPVSLLLSGGIDSALIASALPKRTDLSAYTATFGAAAFDESTLARMTATHAGLPQRFIPIDTESDLEARFLEVVAKLDGQLADSSCLAFYSLCQQAGREVRVLLTGDGADEFFAGYETYRATRFATPIARFVPKQILGIFARYMFAAAAASGAKVGAAEKLARFAAGIIHGGDQPHPQWRRYLFPEEIDELYGAGMDDIDRSLDALDEYAAELDGDGSIMDRALAADQRYYLPGDMLMKADSMSMAHGVEVRVPFLDRRIMEFANSLDEALLSPLQGPDKRILRESLERRGLPRELTRGNKRGFNIPMAGYLRGGLARLGNRLLDREADCLSPFLRPDAVRRTWRRHIDGSSRSSYTLWTLLTLAAWRTNANV